MKSLKTLGILLLCILSVCGCVLLNLPKYDEEHWQKIAQSGGTEEYRKYVSMFRSAKYRDVALSQIEENRWALAQSIDSADSYSYYLEEYPKGKYTELASAFLMGKRNERTPSINSSPGAQKLDTWEYGGALFEFIKNNHGSNKITDDAVEIIYIKLRKDYPVDIYKSNFDVDGGGYPHHLKSTLYKALREDKAVAMVFYKGVQSSGVMAAVFQELGGKGFLIQDPSISLYSDSKDCKGDYYHLDRFDKKAVKPLQRMTIPIRYHVKCKSLITATLSFNLINCANGYVSVSSKVQN